MNTTQKKNLEQVIQELITTWGKAAKDKAWLAYSAANRYFQKHEPGLFDLKGKARKSRFQEVEREASLIIAGKSLLEEQA